MLAPSIENDVLGLPATTSEVFVRYVDPSTSVYAAGLRSFAAHCSDGACAAATLPPVQVDTLDIIETVDGAAVNTTDDYFAAVDTKAAGTSVVLGVLRVSQDSSGTVTTTPQLITVTARALLPDITASGQALLDAIWHERRHELAMEQHRWFDIVRQGRAADLMDALGKNFVVGKDELYAIPSVEVESAGLTQNPGYVK
jgi:hypothetical protein